MQLRYADIRDQIKSGDLIAFTHEAWGSIYDIEIQIVRAATQSEFSHVCVAWCFANRVFVIEAVEPLVRIIPLSNLKEHGFYWIPMDLPMSDEELEFSLQQVGTGAYSKIQAIAAQLSLLQIGADDLWECAELTIMQRRKSGLDLGPKATPTAVIKQAQLLGKPSYFITS